MKKILKQIVVLILMLIITITLTGCGNKLIATKTTEEDMSSDGKTIKYEEKIQISFKDDKVNTAKMEYTFETEDDANTMKSGFDLIKSLLKDLKIEINQKGKKLTIELDKEAFKELQDLEDESALTKEAIKAELEENGYKVK